nr:zinc finger, CCHC-type, retrotransposon Gag domain protein [Tanacetum cinerariifolium]
LKREYHSIRQTSTETSTEFMQRFLQLVGFLGIAAGTEEEQAKNFQWGLRRQRSGDWHQPTSQQSSHRSHDHNNDRHGSDRRGGSDNHRGSNNNNYSGRIPVMDVTRETGVISPTDLPILADKKPGASGRVFAITEGQAANTSGFLATINDTTPEVPSIHDQPIVSKFPDVFPDELPGIPPVHEVEFNIELIP